MQYGAAFRQGYIDGLKNDVDPDRYHDEIIAAEYDQGAAKAALDLHAGYDREYLCQFPGGLSPRELLAAFARR